jgi:hypothetical protein
VPALAPRPNAPTSTPIATLNRSGASSRMTAKLNENSAPPAPCSARKTTSAMKFGAEPPVSWNAKPPTITASTASVRFQCGRSLASGIVAS